MLRTLWQLVLVLWCSVFGWIEARCADLQLGTRTKLAFATIAEAREVLATRDDFAARLSPFDRSARLKSDRAIDQETFLAFASEQARQWTADEQTSLTAAFDSVK